jgi:hypothetical protein
VTARLAALLALAAIAMLGGLLAGGTFIAPAQVLGALAHPQATRQRSSGNCACRAC